VLTGLRDDERRVSVLGLSAHRLKLGTSVLAVCFAPGVLKRRGRIA
jgi:ABC-type branched-subunit amino acid transport system permease subunit